MATLSQTQTADDRSLARRLNEQSVLDCIFRRGPLTRVQVAELTELSKPTISSIVEALVRAGLVRENGRTSGGVGRTAVMYEVNPAVGHVVGVDLGGTKIRAAVCDLFGTILAEAVRPTDVGGTDALVRQIVSIADDLIATAEVPRESVVSLAVGTPGVIDATGLIHIAYNLPGLVGVNLARLLAEGHSWHVTVENDVNMAAVGERWQGLAKQCDSFAFLAVGTGIGMGLLLNGEVWQGHRGGAGEIGHLPLGRDPFDPSTEPAGAFESAASGRGMVGRYKRMLADCGRSVPDGFTAEELFESAAAGDELAIAAVEEEARLLASAIASVNALIAPELVVLGGGIGSSIELLEPIRRFVSVIMPEAEVRVETSALGHRAPLIGAVAMGLHAARTALRRAPAMSRLAGEIT